MEKSKVLYATQNETFSDRQSMAMELCREITWKMVKLHSYLPDNLISNLNDVHGDFLHRVQEGIKGE